MSKMISYDELSQRIVSAIEDELFFNKKTLVPKIKSILKAFRVQMQVTNYNKIETPSETAKRLRAIEITAFQKTFWQRKVRLLCSDKMEQFYRELDELEKERGYI